jgi:hypothetical protein
MDLIKAALESVSYLPRAQFKEVERELRAVAPYISVPQQIVRHTNGDQRQPYRKVESFYSHNTPKECELLAVKSKATKVLERVTGMEFELCHKIPVCQAHLHPEGKVNNVHNLIPAPKKANQIVGRRYASPEVYEAINILVFNGFTRQARALADQMCR